MLFASGLLAYGFLAPVIYRVLRSEKSLVPMLFYKVQEVPSVFCCIVPTFLNCFKFNYNIIKKNNLYLVTVPGQFECFGFHSYKPNLNLLNVIRKFDFK